MMRNFGIFQIFHLKLKWWNVKLNSEEKNQNLILFMFVCFLMFICIVNRFTIVNWQCHLIITILTEIVTKICSVWFVFIMSGWTFRSTLFVCYLYHFISWHSSNYHISNKKETNRLHLKKWIKLICKIL